MKLRRLQPKTWLSIAAAVAVVGLATAKQLPAESDPVGCYSPLASFGSSAAQAPDRR